MMIALVTDFGTSDYFVGAVKRVMSTINENARIVGITHEVPAQISAAASGKIIEKTPALFMKTTESELSMIVRSYDRQKRGFF